VSDLRTIPTDLIHEGRNVRVKAVSPDEEDDLVRSIRSTGIIQPLVVRKDGARFRLVAGHRRFAAALMAGLTEVPAIVDPAPDTDDAILQLVENTQRASLDPIDLAKAIVAILDMDPDMTQEALAKRMGRSPSFVSDALKRLRRDPATQRAIARGRIKGRAATLMRNQSPTERRQLLEAVPEAPLQRVVTRPSTRAMRVPAQDGWNVVISWNGGDPTARMDLVVERDQYEAGVRLDTAQARRLARALRLLCDAMDATLVRPALEEAS
jgi:ParB family chromosome partitioning protein